jgi:hypothetical protein
MVETEYLWGNLLVNDYLKDREGSGKWMELFCPIVFFHISNVESLGYIITESAMICKKTF